MADRRSTKIAKMMVLCWRLTFLRQGQIFFPMHLYGPYTFIWEMLRTYFGHRLYNQLNWNLMMSIRAFSRYKIAKWADRKSKMVATAAILKINFRHLFPNVWSPRAETCYVATGWKWAKILLIGIPRWPQWFHSSEQDSRQSYKWKIFKRHHVLDQWPDFKIFAQKCSSNDPLPKLLKWFRLAEQNGSQS